MKHRLIQDKGKWAYVVEDGMGKEVSRKSAKDREAGEKMRTEAFAARQAEMAAATGTAPDEAPKAAKGARGDVKVEPTREAVTERDLPGETATTADAPVTEEKRQAPADARIARDAGRAPPPIAERKVRTSTRRG